MCFVKINPYQQLTPHQLFQLFWFEKMIINVSNPAYDYLNDFHVTESLIQYFNGIMSTMPQDEGNTRNYLLQFGLYNADDADVKNVLISIQVSLHTQNIDAAYFGDDNIKLGVAYYMQWINYFNYQYSMDFRFQAKPVIWNTIRKPDAYTIAQLERGAIMERYIDYEFKRNGIDIGFYNSPYDQFHGESRLGIEVKHDMKSQITGNYYIECYECHNFGKRRFVPSGILKTSNTMFWLIGTLDEYYIVYENDLRQEYYSMSRTWQGWQNRKKFVSCQSSRGFIIKKSRLQELAVACSITEFVNKYRYFIIR